MAVGDNTGNTYRGQQGNGFATVIGYNPSVDLGIADLKFRQQQAAAKEKEDKDKKLMGAYSQMGKVKPDNWFVHDAQMSAMTEGMLDLGATYLAKGVDPFNDPAAQDFQKLLIENTRASEYSKQFQKRFSEVQSAYKNGEEIDNWDDIVTYMTNPDLMGMVNGDYGKEPKPIFKKPEVSTFKAMNEYWDKWRGNNKERIPTMDDAKAMAEEITNDPTLSQGFASVGGKFKQRFDNLPDEQKEALAARGGRLDGYQQYVAEQMYALSNPNFNTEESILKLAGDIKTSVSDIETGDKTVKSRYSKHTDKDLEGYIDATLQDGAVQREVEAGKYGDRNRGIDFNRKAAIKHYLPTLKKNISTEYTVDLDEAGKEGKKAAASFTNWYDDITSGDGDKFVAAAPYLNKEALARFVPDMPKDATIGNVKYYRSGRMEVVVIDKDGEEISTGELNVKDIPKEMLKNAYMDQYKGTKRNYETTETGGALNAPPSAKSSNSTGSLNSPPK